MKCNAFQWNSDDGDNVNDDYDDNDVMAIITKLPNMSTLELTLRMPSILMTGQYQRESESGKKDRWAQTC